MVVAGALLLLCSFVGGLLGSALVIRRVDPRRFERDVVVDGRQGPRKVPGSVAFSVSEPLAGRRDDDVMTVAALTRGDGRWPVCTFTVVATASGGAPSPVETRPPIGGEVYLAEPGADWEVVRTARLGPGEYEASCRSVSSGQRTFVVGRVLGEADVRTLAGPILGLVGLIVLAGGAFVLGGILLLAGLVRRSRVQREQAESGTV